MKLTYCMHGFQLCIHMVPKKYSHELNYKQIENIPIVLLYLAEGDDYADVLPKIIHFPIGALASYVARIAIPIVDDGDREGPESFFVRLSAADVAVSVVRDTAEVVIEDDGKQLMVL